MSLTTTPLATTPLPVLASPGARQLHLPPELAPDLAVGEEGVGKFILNHPIGRTVFEDSLTPAASTLWRNTQSSAEDLRAQIVTLEQERATPPVAQAIPPKVGNDGDLVSVVSGFLFGAAGACGAYFLAPYLPGNDPALPMLLAGIGMLVVGAIAPLVMRDIAFSIKQRSALQSIRAKIDSEIAVRQELIRDYEDFLAKGVQALAEHPEIYDDYLNHCLAKIDAKIGDVKLRRKELTRELDNIQTRRETTMTREFSDASLRAVALSGLDDDEACVRQSLAQLEQCEALLHGLKDAYEKYREAYSGKLKSYRAKLDDVAYMRSLSTNSQRIHTQIAKLEAQIRADLIELATMIQTTRELEARQLAAIEVELVGA